ncbi:hypothetical protein KP509_29G085000 [Ceratopteris richardii]|uniref:Uncharacterized protein n=1 Tax=Ceratopteris richardii TaxID=49495 RepID=A0A8T2RAT2_CERRI|nr:hypothetical protein KP509_29G085000 [Ceratopteris richardii]
MWHPMHDEVTMMRMTLKRVCNMDQPLKDREREGKGVLHRAWESQARDEAIWREKCLDSDGEVNDGWMDVLDRYTNVDLKKKANTTNLQKLAIRLLSQGTCASPWERTWKRGFVKMEVTLDMIEKEKDDDRLLKLQDSIEEQGSLEARIMPSSSRTHEEEGFSIEAENPTHNDEDLMMMMRRRSMWRKMMVDHT